jgi:hypothetical protein
MLPDPYYSFTPTGFAMSALSSLPRELHFPPASLRQLFLLRAQLIQAARRSPL